MLRSVASRVLNFLAPTRKFRVMLIGLEGAGKTTLMYHVFVKETLTTIPTLSVNTEIMKYGNSLLTVRDFGGNEQCQNSWCTYLDEIFQIIVVVVDATNEKRLDDAKKSIHRVLNDNRVRDCRVLIFANKQDQPTAMDNATISDRLALCDIPQRRWKIQGCSAINGSGLDEGLSWCIKQGC
ncbi:ADP-ribosylation factor 1 [Thraustotheca clavata]|uniref:ADP-ribosylation factor 1 n=1 Tax=Thraustotheca clavata TaxID=74557 RepID=A0A1W0A6S6_9STRA|nr:ADP-ribosylation factor 1 [Thraustotheca clavata]